MQLPYHSDAAIYNLAGLVDSIPKMLTSCQSFLEYVHNCSLLLTIYIQHKTVHINQLILAGAFFS